jgi:hypothetical protein
MPLDLAHAVPVYQLSECECERRLNRFLLSYSLVSHHVSLISIAINLAGGFGLPARHLA